MRRRSFYPAAAGHDRKARSRQLHCVNLDALGGLGRRHLARRRFGAERGVQLPDRGLEARDIAAAAGAGDRAAAAAARCPDSARMGRTALAAPHHLHSRFAARRYHRDVLAAGAPRTRRRSAGRLDTAQMRAGATAAEYRSSRRDRRFQAAAAARRRAGRGTAGDRAFRIDLSGQAAQCAAQDRRAAEGARTEAPDRLCRVVHPRRRQGGRGVSTPAPPNSA